MRYLKSYKVFESDENKIPIEDTYRKLKETIEELKNICLDLEDEGLSYSIFPSDNTGLGRERLKTISMIHNNIKPDISGDSEFYLDISKKNPNVSNFQSEWPFSEEKAFRVSLIQDVILRIESYMETEGWLCDTEFESMDYPGEDPNSDDPLVDYVRITFTSATRYQD